MPPKLLIPFIGLLLIIAGIASAVVIWDTPPPITLDSLPNHDYITEVRKLMEAGRYAEAKVLCEDLDTPEAKELLRQCDAEIKPIRKRIWRSVKAFASGSPGHSIEEAGAALISDMVMYGDIRDLTLQGYYKVSGKETDPLIAALAGAGLLTEFIDAVDWLPALTKALRRAGAISDSLGKVMLDLLKKSRKAGKLSPETKTLFGGIKTIFEKGGFIRTCKITKHARNTADIANAAKLMKASPDATHLIARSAGKNAPEVMEKLAKGRVDPTYLEKLALKGPAGITLVLRGAKAIKKKNVQTLLQALTRQYGAGMYLLPLALISTGLLMNFRTIKLLGKTTHSLSKRILNHG